jgi:hypothetical protein
MGHYKIINIFHTKQIADTRTDYRQKHLNLCKWPPNPFQIAYINHSAYPGWKSTRYFFHPMIAIGIN